MNEKNIVEEIRALKNDEIEKYIEERISTLEDTAVEDRDEISDFNFITRRLNVKKDNTEIHGFIPSKTKLKKMRFDLSSFRLDDTSYYKDVIDYIRKADEKNATNNNYLMGVIQCTIINYLGERGTDQRRNALYDSKSDINDLSLSISNFQRNGTAMCVERSAMAQNILSFLGYDPILIYGYMSSNKGITNEAHAYNCIIREGKAMLVDFTNPIYKDGKYYKPACFPVSGDDLAKFMKGQAQIEIQHKDYVTKDGEL